VAREVREDRGRGFADGEPWIRVPGRKEGPQLIEQHLVVGEDDVLLAAELAEEGRTRDAGGAGDLLDGGLIESLRGEQIQRGRDDAGACGGVVCDIAHVQSLFPCAFPWPAPCPERHPPG